MVLTVPEWPWDAPTDCWLARSYPERPQGAQSCPNWSLTGYLDQAGASRGILKPIWHCWDHFRSLPIWLCPFQNPILVCKYLSPLISHRNGSVFKIYIWILVFRRKKQFRNLFLGSRNIKQIQKVYFLRHPVVSRTHLVSRTHQTIWCYVTLQS